MKHLSRRVYRVAGVLCHLGVSDFDVVIGQRRRLLMFVGDVWPQWRSESLRV